MDKHTTYKSTAEPSIEDEINGTRSLSEVGSAEHPCPLPAGQGTDREAVQDAPVKEMTISGITTIAEANRYLGTYLSAHNKRFAVKAKEADDLHRDIPRGLNLAKILCIRTMRTPRNDFTIVHNGKLYQIEQPVSAPSAGKTRICNPYGYL